MLLELLTLHGEPLLATTLIPPGETEAMNDPNQIRERFEKQIGGVIDAGACPSEPTTVVDLTPMGTGGEPVLVRAGPRRAGRAGPVSAAQRTSGPSETIRRWIFHNLIQTVLIYALPVIFAITHPRSRPWLRGEVFRRQHGLRDGPRHAQPDASTSTRSAPS